jgi:hypothetical protein
MPTLVLKNNTASNVFVTDVGVTVPASSSDTYTTMSLLQAMGASFSLRSLITAGTLTANDGVSDLTTVAAFEYLTGLWSETGTSDGVKRFGSIRVPIDSVAANVTLGTSDDVQLVDASGAARTVNLPTAVGIPGRRYFVKKIDSTVNTVTLSPTGGQTIDGASSLILRRPGQLTIIVSDGANWRILTNSQGSVLCWGNQNIAALADSRTLSPGYDITTAFLSPGTILQIPVPRAGLIANLFARHNTANGNGNSVVYTLHRNGAATALTVTLATGAVGQASNLTNAVIVNQGDRIEMIASKAASIQNGLLNSIVSVELI